MKFKIGFGKELYSFQGKNDCKYSLGILPLGGYVQMLGENVIPEGEEDSNGSQHDSYSLLDSFGEDEHIELSKLCRKHNIEFMSTPFDEQAVDELVGLGVKRLKIAGFESTDVSLGGLGKGLGNLRLEHVFDLRGREHILDHLIVDKDLFRMPSGPYGNLTARDSITDHYAVEAERKGLTPSQFATRLEGIAGYSKDNYDCKILSNE